MEQAAPWLILAGSGGIADVLAALVNQPHLLVPRVAEKQFKEKFPSEHFSWEDIVRWTKLVCASPSPSSRPSSRGGAGPLGEPLLMQPPADSPHLRLPDPPPPLASGPQGAEGPRQPLGLRVVPGRAQWVVGTQAARLTWGHCLCLRWCRPQPAPAPAPAPVLAEAAPSGLCCGAQLQNITSHQHLLTVYDFEQEGSEELDTVILKALVKGEGGQGGHSRHHQAASCSETLWGLAAWPFGTLARLSLPGKDDT